MLDSMPLEVMSLETEYCVYSCIMICIMYSRLLFIAHCMLIPF